jgi:hypothetical protein
MPSIGEDDCERPLEHMPDGLPIYARGFHRHVRARGSRQPIRELQQKARGRRDRAVLVDHVLTRRDAQTGGHAGWMDVFCLDEKTAIRALDWDEDTAAPATSTLRPPWCG